MNTQTNQNNPKDLLWLLLGSTMFTFVGFRWNWALAAWLSPIFLIHYFRNQVKWYKTLLVWPLLAVCGMLNKFGYDLPPGGEIAFALVIPVPIIASLYADRFLVRRKNIKYATLAYPLVHLVLEFLFSLTEMGTFLSVAPSQFALQTVIQIASITGIWGLIFLIGWFAAAFNSWWDNNFKKPKLGHPITIITGLLVVIVALGGMRLSIFPPNRETVRIGGITIAHEHDYWAEIIDKNTPFDIAHQYSDELSLLEEKLYNESERVVQFGAKIIFWSEVNVFVYEEDEIVFIQRAKTFAQENGVYFAPAYMILHYNQSYGENKITMFQPSGSIAFSYTKTKSWYPTDSDGIIPLIDTPYGRVAAAICYDMNSPGFIQQAGKAGVDIMLVPGFDGEAISPYHTEAALFRAIENGFSIVRQVNEGTSMAVDYQGNILAYQDFFTTENPTMVVDIPTKGVWTIYGVLGDWFAYLAIIVFIFLCGEVIYLTLVDRRKKLIKNQTDMVKNKKNHLNETL